MTVQSGLTPWRLIARPHVDVRENRFTQSEFAADLTAVELGRAAPEYQDPARFFGITFLTEGMKTLLASAAARLAGTGGEPAIILQSGFGAGKTHTMLALRHLLTCGEPASLPEISQLVHGSGVAARCFTLVGTGLGARQCLSRENEPPLHTPWGLMAWRLAGRAGLELMAEAEALRAAPGSERLIRLLEQAAPCLLMFDELVAYARALDSGAFETFLSFVQSLTEACKMVRVL